ncbi:MAG: histidine phosphatase family protein [Desulfocapsa sp.]|nr:histidine phosphatase family protein [Desulfocapsa sp.]
MKQLLLCRHAKSSWKDASLADFDRPLNKRGKRDTPRMGKILNHNIHPNLIISSPAKRAEATASILAKELHYPKKKITYVEAIYEAPSDVLLDCIHSFDDKCDEILMVCHNSGITILANILGNLEIPNVPTCGVVGLTFKVKSWKDVKKKNGKLLFFYYPKMLE